MPTAKTADLKIAYEETGPATGTPVLLLHGWPDAPRGWHPVAARLNAQGYRTIAPFLRGFGETRFLKPETPRVAQPAVLAQDAIDLADALQLDTFAVVGHDWGGRIAYTLAALFPGRLTTIATLANTYQPHGAAKTPRLEQARRYWYQWFMCTDSGAAAVHADPIAFARIQWQTWSPAASPHSAWFTEDEFAETASSFLNPDWPAITLNSYRSRWREGEESDPRYAALEARLTAVGEIATPTLQMHGSADHCLGIEETEGQAAHFTGSYRQVILEGIGHFPHREAPGAVAGAVLQQLAAVEK